MITGFDLSQEILAIDVLTAFKSSSKHRRKHILRLLRLYGDQALRITRVMLTRPRTVTGVIADLVSHDDQLLSIHVTNINPQYCGLLVYRIIEFDFFLHSWFSNYLIFLLLLTIFLRLVNFVWYNFLLTGLSLTLNRTGFSEFGMAGGRGGADSPLVTSFLKPNNHEICQ